MNTMIFGHELFNAHLDEHQRVLPVGLLSLVSTQSHLPEFLSSSLQGIDHILGAMIERLKNPHGIQMDDLANSVCGIGLVLDVQNAEKLEEEIRTYAESTGDHFSAFYQALSPDRIPTDRSHHMENFLSVYSHILYKVIDEWNVARVLAALLHTREQIAHIRANLPPPHSILRASDIVSQLGMPERMQAACQRLIEITLIGNLLTEDSSTRHETGMARAVEKFLSSNIYSENTGSPYDSLWRNTLISIITARDLVQADVYDAISSKGWLSERGFLGNYSNYLDLERAIKAEEMPWSIICHTKPDGDFQGNLFVTTFHQDSARAPELLEFMPTTAHFSHLGRDIDLLRSLIRSKTPMRVLIVGPDGSGRRALLHAAIQEANGTKLKLQDSLRGVNMVPFLSQAQISGAMLSGGVLEVDQGCVPDEKDAAPQVNSMRLMKRSLHEAWIVNSLEQLPESFVSLFDLVVSIPTMPLNDRIEMARRLMGDEICEKVAQAATLPGEIASMANWAKRVGVNDWNALSGCLLGIQRARMAKRKDTGDLPVQLYPPGSTKHGFEAVIGEDKNVKRAKELSEALRSPDLYKKMGISPPKGLLLLGPPGTGKTHLARAMAREAGVNMLLADSAALAQNPETIHTVFNEARKQAPCILFMDEIDAIASSAGPDSPDPKRQSILNRLLTELDGFEALDGVLVIGATHRSDLLDAAVTRAGRLGHSIVFKRPEREQREALWKHYTKDMQISEHIDWYRVGRTSTGMSPADISQGANEAGLRAVRENSDKIETRHILAAIEEMLWGEYQDQMPILENERKRTAIHESGHAMLSWHHRLEIDRACVRPQGGALGFVRLLPEEGRYSQLQGDLVGKLNMLFGGLAAETVLMGSHGTGSGSDLFKIRATVSNAVRGEGMHERFPAGISCTPFEAPPSLVKSREAEKVEDELIDGAYRQTIAWLKKHSIHLEALSEILLEKRELDGEEIQAFLDERIGDEGKAARDRLHMTLVQAARMSSDITA